MFNVKPKKSRHEEISLHDDADAGRADRIGDVLMASSDALMAYTLHRVGQLGRMADATRN